jgi:hypothetical protein
MTWDIISAIATLAAFIFTVFIEWPRFKERLKQSAPSDTSLMAFASICVMIGSIIVLIWMLIGREQYLTLGRVGFFLTSFGFGNLMIYLFIQGVKSKDFTAILMAIFFGIVSIIGAVGTFYSLINTLLK